MVFHRPSLAERAMAGIHWSRYRHDPQKVKAFMPRHSAVHYMIEHKLAQVAIRKCPLVCEPIFVVVHMHPDLRWEVQHYSFRNVPDGEPGIRFLRFIRVNQYSPIKRARCQLSSNPADIELNSSYVASGDGDVQRGQQP